MFPPGQATCQETAGFLFSHSCKNPATLQCSSCAKPICVEHARPAPTGALLCTSCRGQDASSDSSNTGDDPYSYSGAWYSDYRAYDHTDHYTRSDREAFEGPPAAPGGTASAGTDPEDAWESDFDAS